MFWDSSYLLILPALIISIIAQARCSSTFSKFSKISNKRGITGAQAASRVLSSHGITNVTIEKVSGNLTDHFDPRSNVIRLSQSVYDSTSVAAVGVACHEAGHAVQYAENYLPNKIRAALVPISRFGSSLAFPLVIIGLLFNSSASVLFIDLGIILYSFAVLFTLMTLPVEFNASSRALKCIRDTSMLYDDEYPGAKSVLTAAALTYVAATFTAIMQLLRLIALSNRRR